MYRFLIIDDEPIVREGIADTIDWADHGFELVGACRDGREGIAAIENLRPHVVLTDICMPFVDGLELASYIAERYPRTKTMLLTGYDEFDYAQEAVRLQVRTFLLKPITADELRVELDAVYRELEDERRDEQRIAHLREQLAESLPILRERFLTRLLRAPVTSEELAQKEADLDMPLPDTPVVAVLCDPDEPTERGDAGCLALSRTVDAVRRPEEQLIVVGTSHDSAVVLVFDDRAEAAAGEALDLAERIAECAPREIDSTVSIGIGEPVETVLQVSESLRGAETALEHRFVLGPGNVITLSQVGADVPRDAKPRLNEARAAFVRQVRTGSRGEAESTLATIIADLRSSGLTPERCQVAVNRLLAATLTGLEDMGIDPGAIPGLPANPFRDLSNLKSLADIETWFRGLLSATQTYLAKRRENQSRRKAVAAEEIIKRDYADPDLNVARICKELAVSKSYFSPLFKSHTGMTFVEYLTDIRMSRAKELLAHHDLRSYQVAELVGYSDAHYFGLTFKKQVGVTPTEYRAERVG